MVCGKDYCEVTVKLYVMCQNVCWDAPEVKERERRKDVNSDNPKWRTWLRQTDTGTNQTEAAGPETSQEEGAHEDEQTHS